jgi:hypothetical protein
MNGYIVHHVERSFGIVRDVYTWKCKDCRTRIHARDAHTASVHARRHECPTQPIGAQP